MKKPLRIALRIVLLAVAVACLVFSVFDGKAWNPLPGRREPLIICFFALMTLAPAADRKRSGPHTVNFVRTGLACALLGVGITSLFVPMALPEKALLWLEIATVVNFVFDFRFKCKNKKAEPTQENPQ